MTRKFFDKKIVLATHNEGKIAEFEHLFAPKGIEIHSAKSLNLPEPDETGSTFEENAALKALAAAKASDLPALADDSGLSVTALGGDPGIYSARWAGSEKDFQAAMQKVENGLLESGNEDRSAAFVCVLALAWPDGHVEYATGECPGRLIWPPKGDGGFGYDPMFMAAGTTKTFGEMTSDEKKKYSHRAFAISKLMNSCFSE